MKALARRERLIGNICRVVKRATEMEIPVIFTNQDNEVDHELNRRIVELVNGTPYELKKSYWDSFRKTWLDELLRDAGVENLIICGAHRAKCVLKTISTAIGFDYKVITSNSIIGGWISDTSLAWISDGSIAALLKYILRTKFYLSTEGVIEKMEKFF